MENLFKRREELKKLLEIIQCGEYGRAIEETEQCQIAKPELYDMWVENRYKNLEGNGWIDAGTIAEIDDGSTLEDIIRVAIEKGIEIDRYSTSDIFDKCLEFEGDSPLMIEFMSRQYDEHEIVKEQWARTFEDAYEEAIYQLGEMFGRMGTKIDELPEVLLGDNVFISAYLTEYSESSQYEVDEMDRGRIELVEKMQKNYEKAKMRSKGDVTQNENGITPSSIEKVTSGITNGEFCEATSLIKTNAKEAKEISEEGVTLDDK